MTDVTPIPIIGIVARTGTFPVYDRLLDGQLAQMLTSWRADGATYLDITMRLRSDHGIAVSVDTVRRWVDIASQATDPEPAA